MKTGNFFEKTISLILLCTFLGATLASANEAPHPAAVGWGNLVVPGLGASLRGDAGRGLLEATTEIGTYYGGTFLARERHFSIDGSAELPDNQNLVRPLFGHMLQEWGMKLHFFNTFYHYQQASLAPEYANLQRSYEQPLYRASWDEVLTAPFKWKNLSTPWTYIPILLASGFIVYSYNTTKIEHHTHRGSAREDGLFLLTEGFTVPLGSSFSEDVLFRGMIQREFRHYTHSAWGSILMSSALFASIHEPKLKPGAFIGGIYYGIATNHFEGEQGPQIASHFWIDFISAMFNYFVYRKTEGRSVPLSARLDIPF